MNIETGGPAYPCGLQSGHLQPLHEGMSMRDWFAGMAMQGLLVVPAQGAVTFEQYARDAYKMADAMLKARQATRE